MDTLQKILEFLKAQPNSRPSIIAENIGVSRQYIQRVLSDNADKIIAAGTGPNRYYRLANVVSEKAVTDTNSNTDSVFDKYFYALDPLGNEMVGANGLKKWCADRNYNYDKYAREFMNIIKKYYGKKKPDIINFTSKMKTTFEDKLYVKKVWVTDFYNFEIFGKTKMGTKVLIAKQSADSQIIADLVAELQSGVDAVRKNVQIDAIGFVSPTIQRQTQLMTSLDQKVALDIPRIKIAKVSARILVPQKTLKNLNDRILNAEQTFAVESAVKYKNILIIDDALGSGATINEISKQILQKNYAEKCYGLALVSSPSGYEVINEV